MTRIFVLAAAFATRFSASPAADETTPGEGRQRDPAAAFQRLDAKGDGKLSKEEFKKLATLGQGIFKDRPEVLDRIFERLDADKDGALSLDEYKKFGDLRGRTSPPSSPAPTTAPPKTDAGKLTATTEAVRITPPGESYVDHEILQTLGKVTFQHRNQIWVGDLDPQTGLLKSENGRDYLMDTEATRPRETNNGPEFGEDAKGWAVFYAKENKGAIQIWRSVWDGKAAKAEPLTAGERHATQLASKHAGAESIRVLCLRGSGSKIEGTGQNRQTVWFDEDAPKQVHEIVPAGSGPIWARWVDGTSKFTFSPPRTSDARGQISLCDTASGKVTALTSDVGDKSDPYGWLAPEHGNQLLVLAVVDDQAIAVYKDQGKGHWDRIATLTIPPESKNKVVRSGSAEPFVAGGKSYVVLSIESEKASIGQFEDGEIWVFGIEDDPTKRFARRCDDGESPVARFDPEIYVGKDEVFVYYNVLTKDRVFEVWRSRTRIAAKGGGLSAVGVKPSAENFKQAADYSAKNGGRAVLVLVDGRTVFERYDNDSTADTATHLHSATKSFWGPAVAAMIEDGLVASFDELACKTITEWKDDPRRNRITVRHLLNLTAGLVQDIASLQGHDRPTLVPDLYKHATGLKADTEPGEKFRYGPSCYYALGELMKRKLATKKQTPLDYLKERILNPIGVKIADWVHDPSGNPHIPNGAHLTVRDWGTFGQWLIQGGQWNGKQIVKKDLLEECFQPCKANPGYGLTFWLNQPGGVGVTPRQKSKSDDKAGWIYRDGCPDLAGALGAGQCRMYMIPSRQMVVVRQCDNEQDRYQDDAFLALLLGGKAASRDR